MISNSGRMQMTSDIRAGDSGSRQPAGLMATPLGGLSEITRGSQVLLHVLFPQDGQEPGDTNR